MLTRRSVLISSAAAAAAIALPTFGRAAANGHSGAVFSVDGVSIRGTDPVGYFTEGAVVAGSSDHSTSWMGVEWHFASAENREMFEMNPHKFAPQYGGYCAFAASKGAAASTDPDAWTVVDDKLYLNYSVNVRSLWQQDIPGNIEKANTNWPGILEALTA